MAFARHKIEKHRLIEMVRQNPILWDCRLPHYKRSDKKKQIKWCELGRAFNVSGERVQRTFTSLRELFRRELNQEKLFGTRFTSKWEYYRAMSFLKDVIRERKTRDPCHGDLFPNEMPDEHYNSTKPSNTNLLCLQPDIKINEPPVNYEILSSGSSTPSISIKEELTDHDDECHERASNPHKRSRRNPHTNMPNNENYPLWSKSGPAASISNHQTKRYSDDEDGGRNEDLSKVILRPTPREILYTKFGEFLSAQLNVLNETVANELMNKILLLVAENR